MLKQFRIRNCNCMEYLLSNIALNVYSDESLLFIHSWNFKFNKNKNHIREKFSVYLDDVHLDDYKDLYNTAAEMYGIKITNNISMAKIKNKSEMIDKIKDNQYVALTIKYNKCPWMPFAHETHTNNHMILVVDYNDEGVYFTDNITERSFLLYDYIYENADQLNIFIIEYSEHDKSLLHEKLISDLLIKVNTPVDFESIRQFAFEFRSVSAVNDELNICQGLMSAPLLYGLSLVGYSRANYCKAVKYVFRDNLHFASHLNGVYSSMENVSQNWLFINKHLAKYSFSSNEKELRKITSMIINISEAEYAIACSLLKILK